MNSKYNKYSECPHCGCEIIGPDDCDDCNGMGYVLKTDMAHDPNCDGKCKKCPVAVEKQEVCDSCNGSGLSNNYYCSNCNWFKEE